MADWDAGQYLKFERERTQPAADLAARIDAWPETLGRTFDLVFSNACIQWRQSPPVPQSGGGRVF